MNLRGQLQTALGSAYRLERELGQGGMSTVFLAEDLKHNRGVAVKSLRPELAAALGADRFTREIRIAARLQHPHILALACLDHLSDRERQIVRDMGERLVQRMLYRGEPRAQVSAAGRGHPEAGVE